jgi:autotransporter passenger strand-loop-strand repeat protein
MPSSYIIGNHSEIILQPIFSAYNNPVTVVSGANIDAQAGQDEALFASVPWNIVNYGNLVGNGSAYGAVLMLGGAFTNHGTVTGGFGIDLLGSNPSDNAVFNQAGGYIHGISSNGTINGAVFLVTAGYVENAGAITSDHQNGIVLVAGGTVVNSGNISGGTDGVDTRGGTILVTNTGSINGVGDSGVYLQGGGTVSNASGKSITGARDGVNVVGTFSATVFNAGAITGSNLNAIYLGHGGYVSNASSGTIKDRDSGIYATNATATVINAGNIEGATIDGVRLKAGGAVANERGGMIAGTLGVAIYGSAGTVENAGKIMAASGNDAVYFDENGANRLVVDPGATFTGKVVADSAGSNTIELTDKYGGVGTLNGVGSVFAGFQSAYIDASANWTLGGTLGGTVNLGMGAALTNAQGATIAGSGDGVFSSKASVIVANRGSINGGSNSGIYLTSSGTISNASAGIITGARDGVNVVGSGAATVTNAGIISGSNLNGIFLGGGGYVSNASTGTIKDSQNAILSDNTATIVNAGYLGAGTLFGVQIAAGGGSVTNTRSGTINAVGGIKNVGSSATVENAGTISVGGYAIYFGGAGTNRLILDPGNQISGKVQANAAGTNTIELTDKYGGVGTLYGLGTGVVGFKSVYVDGGATWTLGGTLDGTADLGRDAALTNIQGGIIAGTGNGVFSSNAGVSVTNAGSINGAGDSGVYLQAGGTISNASTGTITGARDGVNIVGQVVGTVLNAGAISGSNLNAIYLGDGGYVSNASTGTIKDHDSAIYGNNGPATIVNAGYIEGASVNGVRLKTGGIVSNSGKGTISGPTGIYMAAYGKVRNAGAIKGVYGIALNGGGFVSNASGGSIVATANGVDVKGGAGTVDNSGSIVGPSTGIDLAVGGVVSNVSGATISSTQNGVFVPNGAGVVFNAGSIKGTNSVGVWLVSGGSVTNAASGSIFGGFAGIYAQNASATIENAGTIGGNGHAVSLNDNGNNRLIIDPGAVFTGSVSADPAGTNTIELTDKYGAVGLLSGLGSQFTGFQNLQVDSGATWTVSGSISGGAVDVAGIEIFAGGSEAGVTVSSGGLVKVLTGGTTSGADVESGGVLLSISGQLDNTVVLAGGTAEEFVGSSTDTTLSGGHLLVFNGAVASTVDVEAGGFALAGEFAGGTVGGAIDGAMVSSGGIVVAGAGAVVSGGTIQGGATLFQLAGVTSNVDLSGSQLVATTLFGPAQLAVASATTVESGGLLTINADGSTVDSTILGGGEILVSSGGVAEGVMVSSGGTMVSIYGEISNTTIFAGGLVDQFVGSGTDTTLSGGHLLVLNGAVTSMVTVEAGGLALAGEYAGGAVGGTIDDATVSSGGLVVLGTLSVLSGATIQSGGILFELAGQTSNVALAGLQYVGGGLPGVTPPNPAPPAVATDTTVSSGGTQIVNSNGSAVDTNVLSGGEIVFNGGVVSGLSLSKGGVIDLLSFSFSSATSLTFVENAQNTGGTLTVSSGIDTMSINLLGQYVAGGFTSRRTAAPERSSPIPAAPARMSNWRRLIIEKQAGSVIPRGLLPHCVSDKAGPRAARPSVF